VHGLAAQVFADTGAQYGASVAIAGIGRQATAFKLDFPAFAPGCERLSEENRAPVSELRDIVAKLVPRVQHRQRVEVGQQLLSTEHPDEGRVAVAVGIQVQALGGGAVEMNEFRCRCKRCGCDARVEGARQGRKTVAEGQLLQLVGFHRGKSC
jgi:hypothetical protein